MGEIWGFTQDLFTHWQARRKEEIMVEHYPGTTPVEGRSGTQGGNQVTEQAKQQSQQLAHQARQQASELASRTTEQARSQLASQKHNASQRMVPIQSALRESAQQLRNQGQGQVGDYAEKAADQVERFSTYLRQTEVDEIMDEVRGFARRRPGLFLGSAAAIGFLPRVSSRALLRRHLLGTVLARPPLPAERRCLTGLMRPPRLCLRVLSRAPRRRRGPH